MGTYELSSPPTRDRLPEVTAKKRADSLPATLLTENAFWFCKLRGIVVASLVTFGIIGYVPGVFALFGLQARSLWPFVIAGLLGAASVTFWVHLRTVSRSPSLRGATLNLWCQIVFDLLVLTVVVHFVGSIETQIPFAYLFHIVLACIFLSRLESLIATMIACAAYLICVAVELTGLVASAGLYADSTIREGVVHTPGLTVVHVLSTLAIWLVVWYLASFLSAIIRERDFELEGVNRRLREVQATKSKHMVRTTHELKAPFAAIDANTQLLLKGYCGDLSDEARHVLENTAARCRRLAAEIQEMLHLSMLRSENDEALAWVELDVAHVLQFCLSQVEATAQEHDIIFEATIEPANTVAVEDQMKLLLSNLLTNAVLYSHPGGRVRVRCGAAPHNGAVVTIQDEGIGIAEEKLPHIFEEFFRTDEAVRHNKQSTGLGLAIVHHVAQTHGIRITVRSQPGKGTTFELRFPSRCSEGVSATAE